MQGDGELAEFWNLALLTALYAMQGVPLGLTMGSMCVFCYVHSHTQQHSFVAALSGNR